jgi:hypothetical protein
VWQDQANALQLHLVDNSSCIVPDWESRKVITSTDWFKEYKREIEDYEKFIDKCCDGVRLNKGKRASRF